MRHLFAERAVGKRFRSRPFLVVDWLTSGVVLSEAALVDGTVRILRSQFESWPSSHGETGSPEERGYWLNEICKQSQLPTASVAISIARRDLSLKLLELPNIPDDELGPLVALQVESRVQSSGLPVAWDFLPHAAKPTDPYRYVMLATVPSSVTQTICRTATAAGWSNPVLTSGDLLIASIGPLSTGSWQMHVQANRTKLEMVLCYQGRPVASSATAMPQQEVSSPQSPTVGSAAAMIVQSMTDRLLAGSPAVWQADTDPIQFFVTGSFAPQLGAELLARRLPATVTIADERMPRALAVATSLVAGPASALSPQADRINLQRSSWETDGIDFLRPRSAHGGTSRKRRRWIQIACAIAAMFAVGAGGLWIWQRSLQHELARLNDQRQQLQQFIDRGQDVVSKWTYVSRWQNDTLQAAAEIRKFATVLPSRERLIVTRLQLENRVDSEASILRIDGLAQDAEDVLKMNASILKESTHYELRPQGIEPSPVGSAFPSQFRIEAELRKQTPETVTQKGAN